MAENEEQHISTTILCAATCDGFFSFLFDQHEHWDAQMLFANRFFELTHVPPAGWPERIITTWPEDKRLFQISWTCSGNSTPAELSTKRKTVKRRVWRWSGVIIWGTINTQRHAQKNHRWNKFLQCFQDQRFTLQMNWLLRMFVQWGNAAVGTASNYWE